jgi:hypothetical protein
LAWDYHYWYNDLSREIPKFLFIKTFSDCLDLGQSVCKICHKCNNLHEMH